MTSPDQPDTLAQKRLSCQYCRKTLPALGYHFTCHVCGATYCYIHMRRHDGAHSRVALKVALHSLPGEGMRPPHDLAQHGAGERDG